MRLLFVSAQYLPTAGGVERYTHSLASTLVAMGHEAVVATSSLPGLPDEERKNGLHILRLPARGLLRGRLPWPRKNRRFRQLAAELWSQSYDLVVINTRFYPLSLWAARQCRARGIRAVVVEHGTKHLSLDNAFLNFLVQRYEHRMMRRIRRCCKDFYGVSQACCQWLGHFRVRAKGVLYNAVDAAGLIKLAQSVPIGIRDKLGIDPGVPLIAFVGRLIKEKGVWELLGAMALLRRSLPDARLVMAGTGPLEETLRAKKLPGVHLAGQLPYAETVALLREADLFCLPTWSEGFSGTVLEAAAVGACIATTPTGGSPELIQDGESGILLKDRRPETIAEALLAALQNNDWRAAAGRAVQQAVMSRFTWPATAEALIAIASTDKTEGNPAP